MSFLRKLECKLGSRCRHVVDGRGVVFDGFRPGGCSPACSEQLKRDRITRANAKYRARQRARKAVSA